MSTHGRALGQRRAGLLAPVFALRHADDLGIGDVRALREAADFCAAHGFGVLQILPVHETFGDHSPYQAISSRALSPALLSLSPGEVPGLGKQDLDECAPPDWRATLRAGNVRHGAVHPLKMHLLLAAHRNLMERPDPASGDAEEFASFKRREAGWLRVYALYRMLVTEYEGNADWADWRPEHRNPAATERWIAEHPQRRRLECLVDGYAFAQWVGHRQWTEVKRHCERRGVMLMGEMSFGIGRSSADVSANPELFDLDWNIGTPPLAAFDTNKDSETWGQNWGLPAYRWQVHRESGFAWLRGRMAWESRFFHLCRIDHLRGYFRTYLFPWHGGPCHAGFATLTADEAAERTGGLLPRFHPGRDDDPEARARNDRQGREIIAALQDAAGGMDLVAEIMGDFPGYMRRALDDLKLANLVFPQLEEEPVGGYREWALAAYANHDHMPLAALIPHLAGMARQSPDGPDARRLRLLLRFAGWDGEPPDALDERLLARLQEALFRTPCMLAVLLTSDLLGVPQRFNLPGTYGAETWCERLDFPLGGYAAHPLFGPRIATAARLIRETGRHPW